MLMLVIVGCDGDRAAETTLFETAEVDYRQGNYEDAMSGYQVFLQRYPQSPLATTAEMRLRSIHREVSSVMEHSDAPRPSYHGSNSEQSAASGDDATDKAIEEVLPPPLDDADHH